MQMETVLRNLSKPKTPSKMLLVDRKRLILFLSLSLKSQLNLFHFIRSSTARREKKRNLTTKTKVKT
ncbi:hypothetical protein Y1Q_0023198 [Alligator mississippiensis]|uniref:Uncharacterized protein n=1 Tax=Alligator mississippiensis TaxID=8496 RepID=A0A151MZE6_ALLMI|nr:hypothetical protein Y1Q_0023198 [Alligator mississippiensis]